MLELSGASLTLAAFISNLCYRGVGLVRCHVRGRGVRSCGGVKNGGVWYKLCHKPYVGKAPFYDEGF